MPADENALSASIKLKKVKKYDVKSIYLWSFILEFGLKFRYFCQILNLVNYRELSIIFAEIIDNSITKKMAKLSIIDNDNFQYPNTKCAVMISFGYLKVRQHFLFVFDTPINISRASKFPRDRCSK
jgi:hypothetical protein